MKRTGIVLLAVFALVVMVIAPVAAQDTFNVGMILVGPRNDGGWSQAHYEGGLYVAEKVEGVTFLEPQENINAGNPDVPFDVAIRTLVDQGANIIFTASDEFEEDTAIVATEYPDVTFINVSGDDAYLGTAPANLGNVMGTMEWGKMIAGCAAALQTSTGHIGYLGPLINFETRRLVNSAYLGARHCYEMRGMNPDELQFTVTWIGFWFNIPGVTLDPTEEANTLLNNGADVIISGIDTTEGITVVSQRAAAGEPVWAVPYDFASACDLGPEVCLGVPYFHWGPVYAEIISAAQAGTYEQAWTLTNPDWSDLNNPDTSGIGFAKGPALTEENGTMLDAFIAEAAGFAAENPDGIYLWTGPLSYQDGTEIAAEGVNLPYIVAIEEGSSVWYQQQLLAGITGASES
jgi:simple sugar transport system substrate-binding protein